jgi:ComF family protein
LLHGRHDATAPFGFPSLARRAVGGTRGVAARARHRAADPVHLLPRAGARRRRLCLLLVKARPHRKTLLSALGIPFVYDPGPELLSMEAIASPPAYDRARAAVRYDDVARTLVHALKYQDRTDLAPIMGRWMARAGAELLKDADMLIPVPLHWRRGFGRRYNQSGLLARAIARQSGVALKGELLGRVRATEQQVGLSRTQRASNVQGAFQVSVDRQGDVAGRRVVLVDDVLTSGATVDACARALLRAKAAHVDVLVFARVVDGPRSPI